MRIVIEECMIAKTLCRLQRRVYKEKTVYVGYNIFNNQYRLFFRLDILFPRATSRADVPAHPFGDCREGRIPRSSAALQV